MENETKSETKSEAQELKDAREALIAKLTARIEADRADLVVLGVIRVRKARARMGRPVGSKTKRREPVAEVPNAG